MRTLFIIPLVLMSLVSFSSWGADFYKGLTAAQNGDFATAFKEWKPLADQGNALAQSNLGVMYERGDGVPQDYKEAVRLYRLAAEQGNARGQFSLGWMYNGGVGVPRDHKEAVKWYRLAADQGNAKAQSNLGVMYETGRGVSQDNKEALRLYRLAAEQGNAPAQSNLGVMYERGVGVPKDYKEALRLYKLAADQGNAKAQSNLGWMYRNGRGVPQDYKEAVRLFRLAVEQGFAGAQSNLGWMYTNGLGVPKDDKEAVRLYRLATEQGNADAQTNLGWMYRNGRGVPQDYKEAVRLFRLAVEQGIAGAHSNLGWMYERGDGVPQDDKEAVRLYRLAAEQGDAWAEDHLAELGFLIDQEKDKEVIASKSDSSSEALDALRTKAEREERKRKELEQQLAALKEQQSEPKTVIKTEPKISFPNQPIDVQFTAVSKRQDDIAVIIGNANYEKQGKDIPNVNPAYADAEGIKRYFMQAKGVKEGNIIYLKDATGSQLASVFGNQNTHKGQLYNWVKKASNVYIYYAGHGVPGGDKGNAYLVPTDANAQSIGLSGYPLETLYSNLGKLPAKSITVILEACFSGASQAGNLFSKSSPIVIRPTKTMIPENVKVISAGAVDQMASWEQDNSHGLFTKYFLKAMSGEGDKNKDGKVTDTELKNYLGETMTYYARRYYGRDQTVQIMQGN